MQLSVEFREQARPLLRQRARAALELGEQSGEQRLALVRAVLDMLRAYPCEGLAESVLIERLQKVIDRADLESFQRIGVVSGHEYQRRQMLGFERAGEVDAVQRVHLNVEKQELRPLVTDFLEGGLAVAVLADHLEISLRLAELAQYAAARLLVIDDDDVH